MTTSAEVAAPRDVAPVQHSATPVAARPAIAWARELLEHRDLFAFFVWRDITIRYKQTFLGALWAVIQPLSTMLILTAFVGRMAATSNVGAPYGIFAYCALVPWTFFSTSVSASALSMTSNAQLLTKIYFPRIVIPATPVLAGLADFGIASSFLVVLIPWYGLSFKPALALWPFLAIALCVLCLGLGIIFSCLTARYRDMKYALPFLMQLLLFATPIIYPLNAIPPRYQWLAALNPLTGFVQAFRASVLPDAAFDLRLLAISLGETAAILVVALVYLRQTERLIADFV